VRQSSAGRFQEHCFRRLCLVDRLDAGNLDIIRGEQRSFLSLQRGNVLQDVVQFGACLFQRAAGRSSRSGLRQCGPLPGPSAFTLLGPVDQQFPNDGRNKRVLLARRSSSSTGLLQDTQSCLSRGRSPKRFDLYCISTIANPGRRTSGGRRLCLYQRRIELREGTWRIPPGESRSIWKMVHRGRLCRLQRTYSFCRSKSAR